MTEDAAQPSHRPAIEDREFSSLPNFRQGSAVCYVPLGKIHASWPLDVPGWCP